MRISDWSSDVCSSDLGIGEQLIAAGEAGIGQRLEQQPCVVRQHADIVWPAGRDLRGDAGDQLGDAMLVGFDADEAGIGMRLGQREQMTAVAEADLDAIAEIGSASCRERVWQYGKRSVAAVSLKQKTKAR